MATKGNSGTPDATRNTLSSDGNYWERRIAFSQMTTNSTLNSVAVYMPANAVMRVGIYKKTTITNTGSATLVVDAGVITRGASAGLETISLGGASVAAGDYVILCLRPQQEVGTAIVAGKNLFGEFPPDADVILASRAFYWGGGATHTSAFESTSVADDGTNDQGFVTRATLDYTSVAGGGGSSNQGLMLTGIG